MPIVYKYRPGRGPIDVNTHQIEIFERALKLLSEDKIYVPTVKQLNDPAEAIVDDASLHLGFELFRPLAREPMKRVDEAYVGFKQHIQTGAYQITIGADYSNPSVIQPKKVFRFEVTNDKRVVRIE